MLAALAIVTVHISFRSVPSDRDIVDGRKLVTFFVKIASISIEAGIQYRYL